MGVSFSYVRRAWCVLVRIEYAYIDKCIYTHI